MTAENRQERNGISLEHQVAFYAAEARLLRMAFGFLATTTGIRDEQLASLLSQATAMSLAELRREGTSITEQGVEIITGTSREGIDMGLMTSYLTRIGNRLTINATTGGRNG